MRGVATPALGGEPVRRSIYALTPTSGMYALASSFLDAVREQIEHAAA